MFKWYKNSANKVCLPLSSSSNSYLDYPLDTVSEVPQMPFQYAKQIIITKLAYVKHESLKNFKQL